MMRRVVLSYLCDCVGSLVLNHLPIRDERRWILSGVVILVVGLEDTVMDTVKGCFLFLLNQGSPKLLLEGTPTQGGRKFGRKCY